jgi:hypothetical protein
VNSGVQGYLLVSTVVAVVAAVGAAEALLLRPIVVVLRDAAEGVPLVPLAVGADASQLMATAWTVAFESWAGAR